MSWFSSSKYLDFESKVSAATSELIPNGDIDFAEALEISDLIRSKQIPSKESMRILKKRFMDEKNSNMQKSSLKLIDFCIKNGGPHFIAEIATKEFMDPFVIFLKDKSHPDSVKDYLLNLIQTWSILVSKDSKYDYINTIYRKLQDDGFNFPQITDFVDSTLIESKVAPEWEDSDACMLCSKMFTFMNRKHHCRSCGGVFCQQHSSKTSTLPELGISIPVRVCDNCHEEHKEKRKKLKKSSKLDNLLDHTGVDEDSELKRAIEESVKFSGKITGPKERVESFKEVQDEDEAMKAAIEASLRDLAPKHNDTQQNIKQNLPKSTGFYSNLMPTIEVDEQEFVPTQANPNELPNKSLPVLPQAVDINTVSGTDEQSVVHFVDVINNLQKIPENDRVIDPTLIQLHSQLVLLHPKVTYQISKHNSELHGYETLYSKLSALSKLYDDILAYRLKQEKQMYQTAPNLAAQFTGASRLPQMTGFVGSPTVSRIPIQFNTPQYHRTGYSVQNTGTQMQPQFTTQRSFHSNNPVSITMAPGAQKLPQDRYNNEQAVSVSPQPSFPPRNSSPLNMPTNFEQPPVHSLAQNLHVSSQPPDSLVSEDPPEAPAPVSSEVPLITTNNSLAPPETIKEEPIANLIDL